MPPSPSLDGAAIGSAVYNRAQDYPSSRAFAVSVSSIDLPKAVRSKRGQILQLAARHGARNVRVFGSMARGEADQRSDVDLLVDMDPGRSLLDLGGLLMDLRELLGCSVDVVTEKGLRRRIRERVLKEAVPI